MPGGLSGLYPSLTRQRKKEAKKALKEAKKAEKEAKKKERGKK